MRRKRRDWSEFFGKCACLFRQALYLVLFYIDLEVPQLWQSPSDYKLEFFSLYHIFYSILFHSIEHCRPICNIYLITFKYPLTPYTIFSSQGFLIRTLHINYYVERANQKPLTREDGHIQINEEQSIYHTQWKYD